MCRTRLNLIETTIEMHVRKWRGKCLQQTACEYIYVTSEIACSISREENVGDLRVKLKHVKQPRPN
jgi:hypothetical protein